MRTRYAAFVAALLVLSVGLVGYGQGLYEYPGEDRHEQAAVTLVDADGDELAVVDARVADTRKERVRGLSETATLPNGTGMLFVHARETEQTYVMRGMSFPLDIVFVAANGTVTSIVAAPAPDPGSEASESYAGYGKYVLEVPRGYADAVGLDPGDTVEFEYTD